MSKGKKKTQFTCKRNDDDLRDKIVQVKKVVHNRSKTDIALVLQSCEQCDNAVDTAIAKLIGPDKGQDCLKEWEVKAKKSKKSKKSTDGKGNTSTASSSSSASSAESESHTNEHPIKSEEDKQSPTPASPVSTALAPEAGPAQSTSPTKPPLIDPDTKTKSYNKKPKQRRPIKKPRPPKRIREKLKVMAEAAAAASKNNSESPSTTSEIVYEPEPLSPESGIMTASTSLSSSPVSKEPATDLPVTNLPLPPKGRPQQERHSPSEPSLRKLIKDLHRCDISLTRYQQNLQEQCSVAARNLERTFNTLRIGINAREEDLRCELRNVQQTAQLLLQRRKATAIALRRLTESANQLEEAQIAELKKQLKCFISDRKVDEAVGNLNRFYGDPDDLLPSVTKFGKVVTVQETYSSWNENPHAAIEKSSIKVCLPQLVLPKLSHNDHNIIAAATAAAMVFQPRFCLPPLLPPFPLPPFLRPEIGIPFPLPRPIINTNGVFCGFTNQSMPPGRLALPQHPIMPVVSVPSQVENVYPYKCSPEFLAVFQERVRNSLYRQGVCLYDPQTGKAVRPNPPPPPVPPVPPVPPPSHTVPTSSSSNHNNNNNDAKKKTPTQQRRDRKRRQKEREKREKNSKSDANSSCNVLPNSNNKANSHNSSSQSHHNTSNSNTSGHVAANNGDIKSHSSSSSSSPHTQTSNKVGKPISRKVTWIKRYKRYGSKEYEKKSPTSLGEGPPPPPPPAVSQMKPIATKSQKSTPPIVSTSPEPDVSKKEENPSLATSNDPTPQEQEKLPTASLEDAPVSLKEETVSQKECIITVAKEDTCVITSNDEEPPPLLAEEKSPSTTLREESTEATSHDECSNE